MSQTKMKDLIKKAISKGKKDLKKIIDVPAKYSDDLYFEAKKIFADAGHYFLDNFYQTHHFLSSVSVCSGTAFCLSALNEATEAGLDGPFICLDNIQTGINRNSVFVHDNDGIAREIFEKCNLPIRDVTSGPGFSISDCELCNIMSKMIEGEFNIKNAIPDIKRITASHSKWLHFENSLLISEGFTYNIHDAYIYNPILKAYSGIYHDEYGEDTTFYRSIVDYLLYGFDGQLRKAFVKYIKLNNVSRDDGMSYTKLVSKTNLEGLRRESDDSLEWYDSEGYIVIGSGNGLRLTENFKGQYDYTPLGNDWCSEKYGYIMLKGW